LQNRLEAQGARLGDPSRLLEIKIQALDNAAHRLTSAFERNIFAKRTQVTELGAMLRHPKNRMEEARKTLSMCTKVLIRAGETMLREHQHRLLLSKKMLDSLDYKNVLKRGYVILRNEKGVPVTAADQTYAGQNVQLQFKEERRVDAVIGKKGRKTTKSRNRNQQNELNQGKLL